MDIAEGTLLVPTLQEVQKAFTRNIKVMMLMKAE